MQVYKYKAISEEGKQLKGIHMAKSKEEVVHFIRQSSHYPLSVEEMVKGNDIKNISIFNRVRTKDVAILCRQFYTMLHAGITLVSCLDILRQQTNNRKLRRIIGEIYEEVLKGLTFSEGLKKHNQVFPELIIKMVEAGEISGNIDTIMNRIAIHYERESKINNKVRGAMVYPIILSIVAVFVIIFLLTFVMPTFIGMFEESGVILPAPTRVLLIFSHLLKRYWYLLILTMAVISIITQKLLQTDKGRLYFDQFKFKISIVKGLVSKIVMSRFTRTLSTLLASGVPLLQSMDIAANVVGNKYVSKGITDAREEVRKGVSLSQAIKEQQLFSPMLISMLQIGEESGRLDDILDKTANFYEEEVETGLQKMTTMLEPLMIVIMALIIGFIVISMVLPMFDMINTVQ